MNLDPSYCFTHNYSTKIRAIEANANKNHRIYNSKQGNELKTIVWLVKIFEEEAERFKNIF